MKKYSKFIQEIKGLKKDQEDFTYTEEKAYYNNAIDDVIKLYNKIILEEIKSDIASK